MKKIKEIKLDDNNNTLDTTQFKEYSEEIHRFVIDDDERVLESLSLEVHEVSLHISEIKVCYYLLYIYIYLIEIVKLFEQIN